jgi:hypothetical protein
VSLQNVSLPKRVEAEYVPAFVDIGRGLFQRDFAWCQSSRWFPFGTRENCAEQGKRNGASCLCGTQ